MHGGQQLYVFMNGLVIGKLTKKSNGALLFDYDQSWLARSGSRPISLSMPLREKPYSGDIVYNFFDNLLPDNPAIRARIQRRFQVSSSHPHDLLSAIGADCIGAIQLCPTEQLPSAVQTIQAQPLTDKKIARLLGGYETAPLGMSAATDDFRISLAGAQEKTALLWYKQQWHLPASTTPTSHIFKLPIGLIDYNRIDLSDSCENEWLCLQICAAFGLPVPKAQLATFDGVKALIVERFDRRWSSDGTWLMRLPQEDMCQALGYSPNLKYQADGGPGVGAIMQLLSGSRLATQDRETFFRALIVYWLLAAVDAHAKNYSVFLEPANTYRMTPLYDVLSLYPLMGKQGIAPQKARMAMALQGKNRHYHWSKIMPRHFLEMAQYCHFSAKRAEQIFNETVQATPTVVEKLGQSLPADYPRQMSDRIFAGMLARARLAIGT